MEGRRTVFRLPSLPNLWLAGVLLREQRGSQKVPSQVIRPS